MLAARRMRIPNTQSGRFCRRRDGAGLDRAHRAGPTVIKARQQTGRKNDMYTQLPVAYMAIQAEAERKRLSLLADQAARVTEADATQAATSRSAATIRRPLGRALVRLGEWLRGAPRPLAGDRPPLSRAGDQPI
jgi:hypothetical protein